MQVNELIERILEISHDEVAPDTQLKQKALRWLNSAYHELMEDCFPFLEMRLAKEIVLDVVADKVDLPSDFNRLVSMRDEKTGKLLFYKNNNFKLDTYENTLTFNIMFKNVKKVRLCYLPKVTDLLEDDAENAVMIPRQFHAVLVWGALVWSTVYERGFSTATDIKLFQTKWDEAKRDMKLSLSSVQQFNATYEDGV